MLNKYLWMMIGSLAVIIGLVFLFTKINSPQVGNGNGQQACTEEAKICADGSAAGRTGPKCEFNACPTPKFVWNFAEVKDSTSTPKTRVDLTIGTNQYPLGEFVGSCSIISNSSWKLVEGEVSGAICYFAGGGDEFGIFTENGSYVLKKGIIEEGSAEISGTRDNFQTLFSLGSQ